MRQGLCVRYGPCGRLCFFYSAAFSTIIGCDFFFFSPIKFQRLSVAMSISQWYSSNGHISYLPHRARAPAFDDISKFSILLIACSDQAKLDKSVWSALLMTLSILFEPRVQAGSACSSEAALLIHFSREAPKGGRLADFGI